MHQWDKQNRNQKEPQAESELKRRDRQGLDWHAHNMRRRHMLSCHIPRFSSNTGPAVTWSAGRGCQSVGSTEASLLTSSDQWRSGQGWQPSGKVNFKTAANYKSNVSMFEPFDHIILYCINALMHFKILWVRLPSVQRCVESFACHLLLQGTRHRSLVEQSGQEGFTHLDEVTQHVELTTLCQSF